MLIYFFKQVLLDISLNITISLLRHVALCFKAKEGAYFKTYSIKILWNTKLNYLIIFLRERIFLCTKLYSISRKILARFFMRIIWKPTNST